MNYTSNRLPEAYVSVGKNRLKIYNGKSVFLKDGEEFQIELFNPTSSTIGAKILINGNSISSSLLILKPGERSYLERYLDDNRKFKFETYDVENTKEVKEAIKKNGDVRIEFYNEKAPTYVYPAGTGITYIYPSYNYYGNYPFTISPTYFGTTGTAVGLTNTSTILSTSGFSGMTGPCGPVGDPGIALGTTTSDCSTFYCSTSPTASFGTITTSCCDASQNNVNLETGRIEKGSVSDQSFGSYYGDFESYYFAQTEYKLLPNSQKPVEMKDIRQYCPGCRTRVKKSSWKFCPSCGESLD